MCLDQSVQPETVALDTSDLAFDLGRAEHEAAIADPFAGDDAQASAQIWADCGVLWSRSAGALSDEDLGGADLCTVHMLIDNPPSRSPSATPTGCSAGASRARRRSSATMAGCAAALSGAPRCSLAWFGDELSMEVPVLDLPELA